jgi:arylsulfatase A-like enzyme
VPLLVAAPRGGVSAGDGAGGGGGVDARDGLGAASGRVHMQAASLVDVAPTLLARLGMLPEGAAPRGAIFDGAPLDRVRPVRFGESDFCRFPDLNDRLGYLLPKEIAQSPENIPDWKEKWEAQAISAKQRFVLANPWKLVLSPHPEGDRRELFDLSTDPGEARNIAFERPEIADELESTLRRWMAQSATRSSTAGTRLLDEETLERMEALGYIGN